MSVIDELVGQKSVRKSFNRRCCGVRIEKVRSELVRHRGVGKVLEYAKPLEELEVHGRVPLGFDIYQVVARGFHIEGRDRLVQDIRGIAFDGGVAPAVKNQALLSAEKAAGIRPKSYIFTPPGSVLSNEPACFFV
jgi:hypothetical protein